jgi:DNA-binding transcriptional ArsR family regulator
LSLRRAQKALPDDREAHHALREVLSFLSAHVGESVDADRVGRATGLSAPRVTPVLKALSEASVIDCDGDSCEGAVVFEPDTVVRLEVRRFLKSGSEPERRLQRGTDRFRDRYGRTL